MKEETGEDVVVESSVAGKYLTFALAAEEYGVEILTVREIIGLMDITAVPNVPKCVKGVINLRGKVIPVVDLRLKFEMESVAYTEETCIIVINVAETFMGVIVDNVCEVLDISSAQIEPAPDFGSHAQTDVILGMGKVNDEVKILLNIQKILSEDVSSVDTEV